MIAKTKAERQAETRLMPRCACGKIATSGFTTCTPCRDREFEEELRSERGVTAEFSLYLSITDVTALVSHGRRIAITSGAAKDEDDAIELIGENDLDRALRFILDPDASPDGCKILDSVCEVAR